MKTPTPRESKAGVLAARQDHTTDLFPGLLPVAPAPILPHRPPGVMAMSSLKHRLPGEGLAHPKKMSLRLLDAMLTAATWALASAALAVVLHLTSRCLS